MSGSTGAKSANADPFLWVGTTNDSWDTSANWRDSANPQNSGTLVPGPLTPVIIANQPNAGYEAITTGGTAASLALIGNIDLLGSYAIGAMTTIGSLSATSFVPTAASLVLSAATTLTTGGLNVLDGALALASNAALATGPVTIGMVGGYAISNQDTYAYTPGAAGNLLLSPHSKVSITGSLGIASGTVSNVGGTIAIGGGLTVGTVGTIASQTPIHTVSSASGRAVISLGGTMTVAGDISAPEGLLVVTGLGSTLTSTGTLTTGTGGNYSYTVNGIVDSFSGALLALNGGTAQLGGLILNAPTPTPFADTVVYVDAASSIEIGTAGNAHTGAITIDSGRTVTANATGGLYGFLVNNGALIVSTGTLVQSGDVSGTGTIGIARDATWLLSGTITNTSTINFLDTGAELAIGGAFAITGTSVAAATNTMGAVLKGFQSGDAIVVSDPVTSASYTGGVGTNPGTLTLSNNGTTVESIHLAGSYTASNFTISSVSGGGAVISLLSTPGTTTPSATNADNFTWAGAAGGSWGSASWRDTTTGSLASFAPGTLTPVTIATPTTNAAAVITGGGSASIVSVTGALDLAGYYVFGSQLSIGSLVPGLVAGSLHLLSGGSIATGSISIADGDISLLPGATLSASGAATVGSAAATGCLSIRAGATFTAASGVLINQGTISDADGLVSLGGSLIVGSGANGVVSVTNGGSLLVAGAISDAGGILVANGIGATLVSNGTLTATDGGTYVDVSTFAATGVNTSVGSLNGGTVRLAGAVVGGAPATGFYVDPNSIIEIGALGNASIGAITIDPGNRITTTTAATFTGNLVNNGSLIINGGNLAERGNVSGTGVIQIGTNATFALNGGISAGETITFVGPGSALIIGNTIAANGSSTTPYPVNANLVGFSAGNTLIVAQPVTAAIYTVGVNGGPGKLALINQGATVSTLALLGSYAGRTFTVTPTATGTAITLANNVAAVGMESLGRATLIPTASGWSLDLGSAVQGAAPLSDIIGFQNTASGSVGILGGTFSAANVNGFTNGGFAPGLSSLASGQEEHQQTISLSTTAAGVFTETISLSPTSTNGFGSTALPTKIIAVSGTILPVGSTYTLTGTPGTITASTGNDVFNATSTGINSRTSLNGGGGNNVLNLSGGGIFDLGAPRVLANIPTINLAKAASLSTVFLRDASTSVLNVGTPSGGGGTSVIYGGSGSDTINLTAGTDTIVLGSAAETVHAGVGTASIQASMSAAAAPIIGNAVGTTSLEITTAGTGGLSPLDRNLVVTLDQAAHLSLGPARFVTAIGSGGSDTIVAGGSGQTLSGGGGSDLLIGSSAYGDTFADTSGGLNSDTIGNFAGNDLIDATDLNFASLLTPSLASGRSTYSATTSLTLNDGTHNTTITLLGTLTLANFQLSSDVHGGTQIAYLASS